MDVANSENFALDGGRTTVWSSINQPADMVVVRVYGSLVSMQPQVVFKSSLL
jgi:hypothetical protein